MKRKLLSLALSCLFIALPILQLAAQPNIQGDDDKIIGRALDKIGDYQYNSNIDFELKAIGFTPPPNLENEWKNYPAIRKLEYAYLAAENHTSGSGKLFLALLSKSMAQQYDSPKNDPSLKPFLNIPNPQVKFKPLAPIVDKTSLTNEVKQAITGIAKYVDGDGVSLHNILTEKFNLDVNLAYEIQNTSKNNKDALRRGIAKIEVNERAKSISRTVALLDSMYESAKYEKSFDKYRSNSGNNDDGIPIPPNKPFPPPNDFGSGDFKNPPKKPSPPNSGGGIGNGNSVTTPNFDSNNIYKVTNEYRDFVKSQYHSTDATSSNGGGSAGGGGISRSSRSFTKMRISSGGFGGVILGNELEVKDNLSKLESVNWIPAENDKFGTLEFIYQNQEKKYFREVYLEDALASFEALNNYANDDFMSFEEGEGIGLASLMFGGNSEIDRTDYADYKGRLKQKVLLHPAVSELPIGWSLLYSDIAPNISETISGKISNKLEKFKVHLTLMNFDNWKVIDSEAIISSIEDELVINSKSNNPNLFFEMTLVVKDPQRKDSQLRIKKAEDLFLNIRESLYKSNFHYKRLNDFIKTFFIFRYIKEQKAKFNYKLKYKEKTVTPHFIGFEANGKEFFETPLQEGKNWRTKLNEQINKVQLLVNSDSKISLQEKTQIKNYLDQIIQDGKLNDEAWKQINDYYYSEEGVTDLCKKKLKKFDLARTQVLTKYCPKSVAEMNKSIEIEFARIKPLIEILILSQTNETEINKLKKLTDRASFFAEKRNSIELEILTICNRVEFLGSSSEKEMLELLHLFILEQYALEVISNGICS